MRAGFERAPEGHLEPPFKSTESQTSHLGEGLVMAGLTLPYSDTTLHCRPSPTVHHTDPLCGIMSGVIWHRKTMDSPTLYQTVPGTLGTVLLLLQLQFVILAYLPIEVYLRIIN